MRFSDHSLSVKLLCVQQRPECCRNTKDSAFLTVKRSRKVRPNRWPSPKETAAKSNWNALYWPRLLRWIKVYVWKRFNHLWRKSITHTHRSREKKTKSSMLIHEYARSNLRFISQEIFSLYIYIQNMYIYVLYDRPYLYLTWPFRFDFRSSSIIDTWCPIFFVFKKNIFSKKCYNPWLW